MTQRVLSRDFARTLALFSLIAGLMASPARSEGVSPPSPPSVDAPPPPPFPVTVYPEDDLPTPEPASVRRVVERPVYRQPAAPQLPAGDPYGFTAWLNGVRSQSGLGAVGFDSGLSYWASVNNGQQQAMGMGHHVMGPARRQNSGMGEFSSVTAMWMASPAHRAALLDPSISWIGIASLGAYWTFNAY